MFFVLALLVLPLAILVLWATGLAWLTSRRRERILFGTEFALCGVGFIVALALITAPPAQDLGMNVDDWTPFWGWVLLVSSFLCLFLVGGLWALTALIRRRCRRSHWCG